MTPAQYLEQLQNGVELTEISLHKQQLTESDLVPLLEFLNDPFNSIAVQRLIHLILSENKLTDINLSAFSRLEILDLAFNPLKSVTVSDKPFLVNLNFSQCNNLVDIELENLPMLTNLSIMGTGVQYMYVSHLPSLILINRFGRHISRVDE